MLNANGSCPEMQVAAELFDIFLLFTVEQQAIGKQNIKIFQ